MYCININRRQLLNARFSVAGNGNEAGTYSGGGGGGGSSCGNVYADSSCNAWASYGYCTRTYVNFMRTNCKEACGLCGGGGGGGGGSSNCADGNANCPRWASYGYCVRSYVSYMRANCKRSCNVC